jgi:hypothetical protein
MEVTFVWKYADGRVERDPVPTDITSLPYPLEVDKILPMRDLSWVVEEVQPNGDVVMREQTGSW